MTYTDLWEIIEKAQKGSGYTRSQNTARAKTVLDALSQKGWSKAYLSRALHQLDDELLTGWPEELFQEHYMKGTAQLLPTLEASLLRLGVKPRKVRETVAAVTPLENTCYTRKQLLDVAVEYVLGWYTPIAPPNAAHFLQPHVTNVWIPHDRKELLNATYSCRYTAIPRFEAQVRATFPYGSGKVYYHTTNWGGAVSLLQTINVNKSRNCLDFGYKPCFYVSESAADAIDWGVKNARRWSDEVAILVFHLPRNFQKDFDYQDLTSEEWKAVVTTFRDCGEIPEMVDYDNVHDFIHGPMLANPQTYPTEGPRQHRPPVQQLAAKTRAATRFLYNCMKGAVIFRKSVTAY